MSTFWIVFIVLFVLGPVRRWGRPPRSWRRGGWGFAADGGHIDQVRLDELMQAVEQRNQDVELLQSRVTELENRVDFAERLLAERRNAAIESGS